MKFVPAWCEAIVAAGKRWQADDASLLAAAVSYYASLALFPLLLVLIAGIGWFMQSTAWGLNAETQVLQAIEEYASPAVSNSVAAMLDQVKTKAAIGGPLGILGLFVAATTLFAQFERAFDKIWEIPERRSDHWLQAIKDFLMNRGKAFLMLLAVGILLLLNLCAGVAFGYVRSLADGMMPGADWLWRALQTAVSFGISTLALTMLFWRLPKVKIRFRQALRGGLLTAVAWSLGQWLLTAVLVGERFSAYGIVGSFIAVLVWIYYAACVVFLGAEYVQVICRRCEVRDREPSQAAEN
ncbi:MAG: YihY/virulence factor BrkB family protein [Planctomycetes bacterium]|nr:YihY/virulence factor BrkB family protein [Planctomycetota bacterium]